MAVAHVEPATSSNVVEKKIRWENEFYVEKHHCINYAVQSVGLIIKFGGKMSSTL